MFYFKDIYIYVCRRKQEKSTTVPKCCEPCDIIYNHVYLNRGKCEEGTDTGFYRNRKIIKWKKTFSFVIIVFWGQRERVCKFVLYIKENV